MVAVISKELSKAPILLRPHTKGQDAESSNSGRRNGSIERTATELTHESDGDRNDSAVQTSGGQQRGEENALGDGEVLESDHFRKDNIFKQLLKNQYYC